MRLLVILGMLCLMAGVAFAAECETITVADTAIGFTTATYTAPGGYSDATAFCILEGAQIRVRYDGTAPTTTVGLLMDIGQTITVSKDDLTSFYAIRTTSTSGSLTCCYSFK